MKSISAGTVQRRVCLFPQFLPVQAGAIIACPVLLDEETLKSKLMLYDILQQQPVIINSISHQQQFTGSEFIMTIPMGVSSHPVPPVRSFLRDVIAAANNSCQQQL